MLFDLSLQKVPDTASGGISVKVDSGLTCVPVSMAIAVRSHSRPAADLVINCGNEPCIRKWLFNEFADFAGCPSLRIEGGSSDFDMMVVDIGNGSRVSCDSLSHLCFNHACRLLSLGRYLFIGWPSMFP